MPQPLPVLPMSIDEFHVMEHRLGWKHEYWDGAARLSPQSTAIVDLERPIEGSELTKLYSRCHLGNAASLCWHEQNGFLEIPNYFAATHRRHHFTWLTRHFRHLDDVEKTQESQRTAEHWNAVVETLEASDRRWSSELLD